MINKHRALLQYNSRDLGFIISPLMSHLCTASRKVHNKICRSSSYLQNYRPPQLSINDIRWQILRGLFEHKRLEPANIRTNQGNVPNLAQLKQVINVECIYICS